MIQIKIKRVYDDPEPGDGYRVLVDRKLNFGSIILLVLTSMSVARLFILGRSS